MFTVELEKSDFSIPYLDVLLVRQPNGKINATGGKNHKIQGDMFIIQATAQTITKSMSQKIW